MILPVGALLDADNIVIYMYCLTKDNLAWIKVAKNACTSWEVALSNDGWKRDVFLYAKATQQQSKYDIADE